MSKDVAALRAEATPGPWVPQSRDDGATEPWYIDTHAYRDGPEPIIAASYPLSEADAVFICAAANAVERGAILIDPTAPETVAALAAALDVEWAWRELPPEEADGEAHVVEWDKPAMAAAILPAFVARLRGET